ncbi:MAG: DUF262 domain-containing protein [Candidatus Korobacteraceae bacterium]
MKTKDVNLDALIPREDFVIDDQPSQASGIEKISIVHLEGPFFGPDLRKPDFQRETDKWSPSKVADLIQSFVDGNLIPAVILWRAGQYVFVIDGSHRLGALMAWIQDDYGDRKTSLDYFGGIIPEEQRKIAERTRRLVNKQVGPYQDYLAARANPAGARPEIQKRLSNLAVNHIIAQWVPRTDKESAEDSFFKINQSATPIDPTERRILKSRRSASAIAARAIARAGTGHKYWGDFDKDTRTAIETLGAKLWKALYVPPITGNAVTTLDVPVAGRGYSTLSFIFDLVNEANGVEIQDSTAKNTKTKDVLPVDENGQTTVEYLKTVEKRVQRITGDSPGSLGIHPVVYFYTRSGAFQPTALIAASRFLEELASKDKLKEFTKVRRKFEEFLILHKEALSLIIHKLGSGERHIPWLQKYYSLILDRLWAGKSFDKIQTSFSKNPDFAFVTAPQPSGVRQFSTKSKHKFSSGTKTAAFFAAALPGGARCHLCGALLHLNSVHTDHVVRARDQGTADMRNAKPAHPYCDSAKDVLEPLLKKSAAGSR